VRHRHRLSFIGGLRYVPTFFHGKEIQHAQRIYGGSILLGSGFVIYAIPQILPAEGWRGVFFTTGGMAGALFVLWILFAPGTPAHLHHARNDWREVVANRTVWILAYAQLASFGTVISAGVWTNALLTKNLGLTPKAAGAIGSLILLLGIVLRPVGGMIVGQRVLTPKKLIVYSTVGLAASYWLIGHSTVVPMAVISIVLAGIMSGLPFAPIFNHARESCPNSPGVAMGFVNTAGALGVMAFPPIIGRHVDASGTFVSSFLLLAFVTLLTGLCSLALASHKEEMPLAAAAPAR
jgi:nitrate/nitrite transporter NarK